MLTETVKMTCVAVLSFMVFTMNCSGEDDVVKKESIRSVPGDVEELWRDVDVRNEPLEVEIVREWTEDGAVYKFVRYTIATWNGEKAIMAAYYGYPEGGKNLPALLHIHGGGQKAFLRMVKDYVEKGYACMSVNWGGRDLEEKVNTDWGAVDPTQKNVPGYFNLMPSNITIDNVESPRNNNWYMLTYACRRALTFLEQQPEVDADRMGVMGHSMGGNLTMYVAGSDPRVKAAVPSCGSAGYVTYDLPGLPGTAKKINGDLQLFRQTLAHQAYSPKVRCPILLRNATNDFHGIMDRAYKTYSFIPHDQVRFSYSPHLNHLGLPESLITCPLWFDQHLKNTFTFPQPPSIRLSLTEADGIPLLEVTSDASLPIVSVDLYYGMDLDPRARFWRDAQGAKAGEKWVAKLPVFDTELPLYAFANVIYQLDRSVKVWGTQPTDKILLSSNMVSVTPDELQAAGVKATDAPSLIIDDFARGWHDWYVLSDAHDPFVQWWTRKVTDPKWRGPAGAKLKITVKTTSPNQFTIVLMENQWRGSYRGRQKTYEATFSLEGSADWQTVTLKTSDFLDVKDGTAISGWDELDLLGIKPGVETKKWTAPRPEFKEISWTY